MALHSGALQLGCTYTQHVYIHTRPGARSSGMSGEDEKEALLRERDRLVDHIAETDREMQRCRARLQALKPLIGGNVGAIRGQVGLRDVRELLLDVLPCSDEITVVIQLPSRTPRREDYLRWLQGEEQQMSSQELPRFYAWGQPWRKNLHAACVSEGRPPPGSIVRYSLQGMLDELRKRNSLDSVSTLAFEFGDDKAEIRIGDRLLGDSTPLAYTVRDAYQHFWDKVGGLVPGKEGFLVPVDHDRTVHVEQCKRVYHSLDELCRRAKTVIFGGVGTQLTTEIYLQIMQPPAPRLRLHFPQCTSVITNRAVDMEYSYTNEHMWNPNHPRPYNLAQIHNWEPLRASFDLMFPKATSICTVTPRISVGVHRDLRMPDTSADDLVASAVAAEGRVHRDRLYVDSGCVIVLGECFAPVLTHNPEDRRTMVVEHSPGLPKEYTRYRDQLAFFRDYKWDDGLARTAAERQRTLSAPTSSQQSPADAGP